jgi:hypothetical protein
MKPHVPFFSRVAKEMTSSFLSCHSLKKTHLRTQIEHTTSGLPAGYIHPSRDSPQIHLPCHATWQNEKNDITEADAWVPLPFAIYLSICFLCGDILTIMFP